MYRSTKLLVCFALFTGMACTGTVDDLDQDEVDTEGSLEGDEQHEDLLRPSDETPELDDVPLAVTPPGEGPLLIESRPSFQLPFPCGQVWSGQTRTNHIPYRAVDFNRPYDYGDTVVASAGGTVTVVANYGDSGYGRWIEINHGDGYRTRYAHLSAQYVYRGQWVSKGQRLGAVGSTGNSTGPHLHYEQRYYGSAVKSVFNGYTAYYFGSKSYRSYNRC
jgi:murein DD-endopeptidase MepM/ murein hydrolase activator NlpD